ncbi:hypothetical protein NW762_008834 [Fusarium torreyae]|uniref:Uncharacterized protein n=1 Tax=Fusarium torreyae TaxID=1237075 RepID=A0A9W8RY72_9HYPO|nr:hypothetical protein NW762_008834 [Fusarium torreyae]
MPPSNEAAMQHRTLPSQDFPGEFSMPFPGPQPTINHRRQYMRAFCQWYWMCQDFESRERETRQFAQLSVAEHFIETAITSCRVSLFEWATDQMFWLVGQDELHDEDRILLNETLQSVSAPTVEVMELGGQLHSSPLSQASVEGWKNAWDEMYPVIGPQGQPFMSKLPAEVDLWTHVPGLNRQRHKTIYKGLKMWVMRRTEGVCLDLDDRTNFEAHISREKTKNPDAKLKFSTWVSWMKTHILRQHLQHKPYL